MKTITRLLALVVVLASCEKKEVKPEAPTAQSTKRHYNFRTTGFTGPVKSVEFTDGSGNKISIPGVVVLDSSSVYVNAKLRSTESYGYHLILNPGDRVTFYFKGVRNSSPDCNLAIWRDSNNENPPSIKYFQVSGNVISGEYVIE